MDLIDLRAGLAEPPSRIHGDLWAGNVLWSGEAGWLIDPAAHGGHRETDLATLALFGAPHLDRQVPPLPQLHQAARGGLTVQVQCTIPICCRAHVCQLGPAMDQ